MSPIHPIPYKPSLKYTRKLMSLQKFKQLTLRGLLLHLPIIVVAAFFTYIIIDIILR